MEFILRSDIIKNFFFKLTKTNYLVWKLIIYVISAQRKLWYQGKSFDKSIKYNLTGFTLNYIYWIGVPRI